VRHINSCIYRTDCHGETISEVLERFGLHLVPSQGTPKKGAASFFWSDIAACLAIWLSRPKQQDTLSRTTRSYTPSQCIILYYPLAARLYTQSNWSVRSGATGA
jgi:hypothetical protein